MSDEEETQTCCKKCYHCCLREYHPLPENPGFCQRFLNTLYLPPAGNVALGLLLLLLVVCFWGIAWSLDREGESDPGKKYFSLIVLWITGIISGVFISLIRLPPLVGMLINGILMGNSPLSFYRIKGSEMPYVFACIRSLALSVILVRAGLGLNPSALRRLSFACLRLSFTPCLTETVTVAVAASFLLHFPWLWAFMLGFALSAVSPAVVVPGMLNLQKQKYGVAKGIPTLLIAAASADDVVAIGGFGIIMSITFQEGNTVETVLHGPLEVLSGFAYGMCFGIVCWYLPEPNIKYCAGLRTTLMFAFASFGILFSRKINIPGAGAIGCLVLSFVAAHSWRKDVKPSGLAKISSYYAFLWMFFEPLLFGLVGSEITYEKLMSTNLGQGFLVLLCGLTTRTIAAFLVVTRIGFTFKEKLFIALAWVPKATVQAAMGPIALDYVREKNLSEAEEYMAIQILTIATLSILITAPLGAIIIAYFGPLCLTIDSVSPTDSDSVGIYTPHDGVEEQSDDDYQFAKRIKILTLATISILILAPLGAAIIAFLGPFMLSSGSFSTTEGATEGTSEIHPSTQEVVSNEVLKEIVIAHSEYLDEAIIIMTSNPSN